MVKIDLTYEGDLECVAVHCPSGSTLRTDAPVDNQGKGSTFSPTDLLATSVGACVATIIGITARSRGWNLDGMKMSLEKEMATQGPRRISRITVEVEMPILLTDRDREVIEKVPAACPVGKSLHPDVEVNFRFHWPLS